MEAVPSLEMSRWEVDGSGRGMVIGGADSRRRAIEGTQGGDWLPVIGCTSAKAARILPASSSRLCS